jgi:hypothetical protein
MLLYQTHNKDTGPSDSKSHEETCFNFESSEKMVGIGEATIQSDMQKSTLE